MARIIEFSLLPLLTIALAFGLALYLTPLVRKLALTHDLVDRPDGKLKQQKEAVPYLGGLAIYLAFLSSVALSTTFDQRALGLLLGGTIILMVGLIDDMGKLSPSEKLIGQLIACFVLIRSGLFITLYPLPLYPYTNILLSILWLLTITNAFNIIDVMDGLCSSLAVIGGVALAISAALSNQELSLVQPITLALAGACLGFLKSNVPPAKIYLGDAGSMFLGFMLAALCMLGNYSEQNQWGFMAPLFIVGIPLFDLVYVSLVRMKKGIPPYRGSPDHFALRLQRKGFKTSKVLVISICFALMLALEALLLVHYSKFIAMLGGIILLICLFMAVIYLVESEVT